MTAFRPIADVLASVFNEISDMYLRDALVHAIHRANAKQGYPDKSDVQAAIAIGLSPADLASRRRHEAIETNVNALAASLDKSST